MDILCCMGIGFFAAALWVNLPQSGAVARFVADFCVVCLAFLLAQAYAAQASNAGVLRFYMLCALAVGAFGFVKVLAPYHLFLLGIAQCVVAFPLRILTHKLMKPAFFTVKKAIVGCNKKIKGKNRQKTAAKQLQNNTVLLYNSNVDVYTFNK